MRRFTLLALALAVLGAGSAEARSRTPDRGSASRQAKARPVERRACTSAAVASMYYSTERARPRIRTSWRPSSPAARACATRGTWT